MLRERRNRTMCMRFRITIALARRGVPFLLCWYFVVLLLLLLMPKLIAQTISLSCVAVVRKRKLGAI